MEHRFLGLILTQKQGTEVFRLSSPPPTPHPPHTHTPKKEKKELRFSISHPKDLTGHRFLFHNQKTNTGHSPNKRKRDTGQSLIQKTNTGHRGFVSHHKEERRIFILHPEDEHGRSCLISQSTEKKRCLGQSRRPQRGPTRLTFIRLYQQGWGQRRYPR